MNPARLAPDGNLWAFLDEGLGVGDGSPHDRDSARGRLAEALRGLAEEAASSRIRTRGSARSAAIPSTIPAGATRPARSCATASAMPIMSPTSSMSGR